MHLHSSIFTIDADFILTAIINVKVIDSVGIMETDVTGKDDAIDCRALGLCPCQIGIPMLIGIETRGDCIQNPLEIDSNLGVVRFISILEPQMHLSRISPG